MKDFLFRTSVSLFFIGLLVYLVHDDAPRIVHTLKNINKTLLCASVLIFLSSIFILALRLSLIFGVENVKLGLIESSNLTFIGYFFNNFLPTSVGGDIVKALCASRITGEAVKSVSSVMMDRIFGLFTFILIPSVSLIFFLKKIENPAVPLVIYSFLVISLSCCVLLFSQRAAKTFSFMRHLLNHLHLMDKAKKIYDRLHNFKNHKVVIAKAMFLSLVGQSISIIVLYLLALALGAKINMAYFFLLVPVVHLLSMLPSLNGLGIREGAYVYFLTPYVGRENSAAIGILWLGLLLLLSLIGGVIYLVRQDYHIQFKRNVKRPA